MKKISMFLLCISLILGMPFRHKKKKMVAVAPTQPETKPETDPSIIPYTGDDHDEVWCMPEDLSWKVTS